MFCKNCGNQIDDNAVVCPHCGCATDNFNQNHRPNTPAPREDDAPNAGFAVLSFFVPIVGLILYLVWNDTMPMRARSCGKGAIIGFIVWLILGIIFIVSTVLIFAHIGSTLWNTMAI